MNYLFSDFYLLAGAADKETRTVGDAFRRMAELMAVPVTPACLSFALEGLVAGGYVTITPSTSDAGETVTTTTPISATEAGRKAALVSGIQKFFGEERAFNKNEMKFSALERPAVDHVAWAMDDDAFAEINDDLLVRREVSMPLLALTDNGDDVLTLTLRHPDRGYSIYDTEEGGEDGGYDPDSAETADAVTVTGERARILQAVSDLLAAVQGLLTEPRTRKVALHGADRSYVVTLAHAASEYGTTLRMTVEPIRFNRQRFYGKCDGALDYAQCGAPVITAEMNGARTLAARLLPCALSAPRLLTEDDVASIVAIHRRMRGI